MALGLTSIAKKVIATTTRVRNNANCGCVSRWRDRYICHCIHRVHSSLSQHSSKAQTSASRVAGAYVGSDARKRCSSNSWPSVCLKRPRPHAVCAAHGSTVPHDGQQSSNWLFNRNLHYHEAVIEIGETVAVLGAGVRNPDLDVAANVESHNTQPRILFSSSAKNPLVISDWPKSTRNKTITVPSARLSP